MDTETKPQSQTETVSVLRQLSQADQQIAALNARIVVLEANQKPVSEKKPVSDEELSKAVEALQAFNAGQLKTDSPKLNLSLSGKLGFVPMLSLPQKGAWAKVRDAMRRAHSLAWKAKAAVVTAHLRRAVRTETALMRGSIVKRKTDGVVTAVSLGASKLAKPLVRKGKGKNGAKPAQVAAKVAVPGNANPPAKV